MKVMLLSYMYGKKVPCFGRASRIMNIRWLKQMRNGASSNSCEFTLNNHLGTHIDCPAHFFNRGRRVSDYPPRTWVFKSPFVLKIKAVANRMLGPADFTDIPRKTDILLIKTGFSRYRGKLLYSRSNPGILPEAGFFLRKKYPNIRTIGFDFISLSSFQNRKIGRQAHRVFLDPHSQGKPILVIEDMCLSANLQGLSYVWVAPLLIENLDSAPCTVMGIFE